MALHEEDTIRENLLDDVFASSDLSVVLNAQNQRKARKNEDPSINSFHH